MEEARFDHMAKVVGRRTGRRRLLLGVMGAVLGRALTDGPVAAKPKPGCLPVGATCRPGECCPPSTCLRPTHDAPEGQCRDLTTCRRDKTCLPVGDPADCRQACNERAADCRRTCNGERHCLDLCDIARQLCVRLC
jgi:hypothetical protein